jgi:hypothetical protein
VHISLLVGASIVLHQNESKIKIKLATFGKELVSKCLTASVVDRLILLSDRK